MKKNKTKILVGFSVVFVLFFAAATVLKGRTGSISELSKGDKVVQDKSDGYSFTMPASWYLEKTSTTSVSIYPDYDPGATSSSLPECKIEISVFSDATVSNLSDWVTNNLHADPTAEILEISRSNLQIDGAPALQWQGSLNGVTTTLVYVSANGRIFEMAPSMLNVADNADADDCDIMLEAIRSNFHFENNEL